MSTFLGWEPAPQSVGVLAALLFGLHLNVRHRYDLRTQAETSRGQFFCRNSVVHNLSILSWGHLELDVLLVTSKPTKRCHIKVFSFWASSGSHQWRCEWDVRRDIDYIPSGTWHLCPLCLLVLLFPFDLEDRARLLAKALLFLDLVLFFPDEGGWDEIP